MKTIPVWHSIKLVWLKVLLDDEDYERVKVFTLYSAIANKNTKPYLCVYLRPNGYKGKSIVLSRFILNITDPKIEVDHKNQDSLDNRKENLRICIRNNNIWNRKPYKFRKFKGTNFYKPNNNWRAQITVNGRRIHLGYFNTEEDAAHAYDRAAKDTLKNLHS